MRRPNVILLNGACGIGKSTIAKLLHEKLEFSFLREKDSQRRNISHYKDTSNHQNRSGSMILNLTKHVIQFCIEDGVDMIFDGVLIDSEYISNLQEYIDTTGGRFVHIYLNAPKEIRSERLKIRGIGGSLTYEKAEFFYDSLCKLHEKMEMLEIDTNQNTPEEVCNQILKTINSFT